MIKLLFLLIGLTIVASHLEAPGQSAWEPTRVPSSESPSKPAVALPIFKDFHVSMGEVELRGSIRPRGANDADADIALRVHSAKRHAEAEYRYRLHVSLIGSDVLELGMKDRRMYAILPRDGRSWMSLLTSKKELCDELDIVRLDGAGEED